MNTRIIPLALAMSVSLIAGAHAQGTLRGAAEGADSGGRAAGPVGAVVGGTVGAVTGTVNGILGVEDRHRFHEYVIREHRPSFTYSGPVEVGTVLPAEGPTYYEVPEEYHVTRYRYAVVNDHYVLVDPATRRVVEIVD